MKVNQARIENLGTKPTELVAILTTSVGTPTLPGSARPLIRDNRVTNFTLHSSLFTLLRGTLDLVFAPSCIGCGGPIPTRSAERLVCAVCWARARTVPLPRCDRCWTPLPASLAAEPVCRQCPELRPAIRAVRSAFLLEGPARRLVHGLKYRGWHSVAKPMASRMAALAWPAEVAEEVRLVVPVPLSTARARQRGYNQAAVLAHEFARLSGWRCATDLLDRTRSAGSQTVLHPAERRANVAGAFRVRTGAGAAIHSEHVLLLDDVWTTGATALACAEALLTEGARAVSVLTFARALPELEHQSRRAELAGIS